MEKRKLLWEGWVPIQPQQNGRFDIQNFIDRGLHLKIYEETLRGGVRYVKICAFMDGS